MTEFGRRLPERRSRMSPDHSPEFGRRISWSWAARRAFETVDTSHRLRRALLAGCVTKCSHLVHCEWRSGLCLAKGQEKQKPTRGRHSLPIGGIVLSLWSAKRKTNVFVSYRGRVAKVAPECLRKASVAEQMSWDMTTKEKALLENALDGENLSCEEPCARQIR